MYDVIKVKVNNQKVFYSPKNLNVVKDDFVIVEYENNLWFGKCIDNKKKVSKSETILPFPEIIRKATKEDIQKNNVNNKLEQNAIKEAVKLANKLKLNMNFINASYTFDKKQLYFIYIAEERIDFRELAKKLAQKYKTRIELRQIGVRDKAKTIGGIGPCGLFLCCNSFLTDFNSVSINMAKNQFLALNPSKINGVCGRLLCCLNYEDEIYKELKKDLPKVGSYIKTKEISGKIIGVDVFKKTCKVEIEKNNIVELKCEDVDVTTK